MPKRKGGRTTPAKAPARTTAKTTVKKKAAGSSPTRQSAKKAVNSRASTPGTGAAKKSIKKKAPVKKAAPPKSAAATSSAKKTPAGSGRKNVVKSPTKNAGKKDPGTRRSAAPRHTPRLDRNRRQLDDETLLTPPSSLDLDRHGSAARTGRAELAEEQADHATLTPDIAAGDVDVNVEDAYFTGDEAPGGDNPTPDQDVVDEIGKALGVVYADDEELRASDKVADRDKSRWELDPASAEDYRDRDKE